MRGSLFSDRATASPAQCSVCALALFVLLSAPRAGAASEAPSVELSWSGPGTEVACLGGEALTRAVNEYLGREAISAPPAELLLSIAVERQKNGWRALIKLTDQRAQRQLGERELSSEGPLCSGLDEPLELAVALLVDSELGDGVSPAPNEAKPAPASEPPAPEHDEEADEREEPLEQPELFAKQRWRFGFDASLLAVSGVLPSLAAGAEVGFDASPTDWLAFRAHGAAFVPQTLRPGPSAEVRAWAFYAGAALCPQSSLGVGWTLMGCFGLEAGRLSVTRTGFEAGSDSAHRLLMGSVGARLTLALSPKWAALGQFTALLPFRQDRFLVSLDGKSLELFEVSVVPWVAGVGGSFMF